MSPPATRPLRLPPDVQHTIRSLHPDLKRRMRSALDTLRTRPERGKALVGELTGWYSWRVGTVRIIYRQHRTVVEVAAIGPRATIYFDVARRVKPRH